MKNQQFLNTPWDPTTPFETRIDKIEEVTEIADSRNQPLFAKQVLGIAYTLVFDTGMYFDKYKTWNRKTNDTKYWTTFKYHFLLDQKSLRLQQQTTQRSGFHTNIMREQDITSEQEATEASLSNLATATVSDRQYFYAVVENNTTLTKQTSDTMEMIKALQVNQTRTNPRNGGGTNFNSNESYCWSHGFRVSDEHNSNTCKHPKPGHQTEANKKNMMGGSKAGKRT